MRVLVCVRVRGCARACVDTTLENAQMVWGANYHFLASATMFALFFAGDRVAPKTFVDGIPVQEYLQSHFLGAMAVLVRSFTSTAVLGVVVVVSVGGCCTLWLWPALLVVVGRLRERGQGL